MQPSTLKVIRRYALRFVAKGLSQGRSLYESEVYADWMIHHALKDAGITLSKEDARIAYDAIAEAARRIGGQ